MYELAKSPTLKNAASALTAHPLDQEQDVSSPRLPPVTRKRRRNLPCTLRRWLSRDSLSPRSSTAPQRARNHREAGSNFLRLRRKHHVALPGEGNDRPAAAEWHDGELR